MSRCVSAASSRFVSATRVANAVLPVSARPFTLRRKGHGIQTTPIKQTQTTFSTSATSVSAPSTATSSTHASASAPSANGKVGRDGTNYWLTSEQIRRYHAGGYMALKDFLTEEELQPIETVYNKFMNREIAVPEKDFCDMSQGFGIPYEEWQLINAMLPRKYYPPLQDNIYEKRAAHVMTQLFPDVEMGLDYDQLLAKKPSKKDAVFAWHADMAYWPMTPDTRTATFSLALDATTRANGCLRFVPGSHLTKTIRPHKAVHADRSKGHAIACSVKKDEKVEYVEVGRGSVTVHNEYVVHGSGGNLTQGWRRTYVAAFRTKETIRQEREAGFTHSHNDEVNWDSFNKWQQQ